MYAIRERDADFDFFLPDEIIHSKPLATIGEGERGVHAQTNQSGVWKRLESSSRFGVFTTDNGIHFTTHQNEIWFEGQSKHDGMDVSPSVLKRIPHGNATQVDQLAVDTTHLGIPARF